MSNQTGSFIWYELMTSDPQAAAAFYEKVVGWHAHGFDNPDIEYTLFDAPDGKGVAGLMQTPEDVPSPPAWFSYIGVEDVDATAARAQAAGASVLVPPTDIPNVGRFAMLKDRQGVPFYVMHGTSPEGSTSFAPHVPGHAGWNELHTTDWKDAFAFYGDLFGWAILSEMDMGPMGSYAILSLPGVHVQVAAMFNSPAPVPNWLLYFNVPDLDAAAQRVTDAGGAILHGPMDVPEGNRIVQARDPQGAHFALVGPSAGDSA